MAYLSCCNGFESKKWEESAQNVPPGRFVRYLFANDSRGRSQPFLSFGPGRIGHCGLAPDTSGHRWEIEKPDAAG